jgi:hypothetical protein
MLRIVLRSADPPHLAQLRCALGEGCHGRRRDQWLRDQGFRILRFWNNEVLNETNAVLEVILAAAIAVGPSPGAPGGAPPSPRRGEGKKE